MKRSVLDILACPIDKHYPLELYELRVESDNIIDGVLYCEECSRFYPIIEEIPIMLPDELRRKNEEEDFLKRYRERLPDKIINSRPWHKK